MTEKEQELVQLMRAQQDIQRKTPRGSVEFQRASAEINQLVKLHKEAQRERRRQENKVWR